ncbi:LLM class flavin-dependent oxidoreductase [Microbispora sp. KK1-11]|uniref:LLM class flavin-dependent oxidoreductase n=1 Tax=Microbispora sp. KK1-11 TaxID=2053005 RepID=UPI001158A974|nr:LLM class flavin-dependent oxidoreductase [Microbispora sp. KK1-11]TQS28232.1 LLM class flavin-dependent oxidoreductase [Microbispora sp. KK1-11]
MGDSTTTETSTYLAIGLGGDHLAELIADPRQASLLDGTGAAFVVAGIDRIDGSAPAGVTVEPTVAAAFLAAHAPGTAFLAAAAPHRDHPYNLARRVASLDHLSGGRSGLILGVRDGHAPGDTAWGGAGLTEGAPLGVGTTRDVAVAVQKLWQSWPRESIVADRESRIFARAEQIVHVDHRGVFDIAGPLTVPSTAQGSPVLAWYADSVPAVAAAGEVADLVVLASGDPDLPGPDLPGPDLPSAELIGQAVAALDAAPSSRFAGDGRRPLLFVQVVVTRGRDAAGLVARAESLAARRGVDGILLRPDADVDASVVRDIGARLAGLGVVRASEGPTLRDRLALPKPARLLAGARPVFPAPESQPAPQPAL